MPGVFDHIQRDRDPSFCFVMMPFDPSFDALYRVVARCCKEQGLQCERADSDAAPGRITAKIYEYIARSGIIVADMTGKNPNVFYELGLAHAVCDNVILLVQDSHDVPFDLRDFLHIKYDNSFAGAEKLVKDFAKALTTITRSALTGPRPVSSSESPPDDARITDLDEDPEDLDLLHLRAEMSRRSGNRKEGRRLLMRALELSRAGQGDVDGVGNCAIEAELSGQREIADELYQIALSRGPDHVNNQQCYVSFILDKYNDDPSKLAVAGSILDALEKTAERAERTIALRAEYIAATSKGNRGVDPRIQESVQKLVELKDVSSFSQALPTLKALVELRKLDELRQVIERLRERFGSEHSDQLDRILADALASSRDARNIDEAIRLYRPLVVRNPGEYQLLHNFATCLWHVNRSDTNGEVMRLWSEAYRLMPGDVIVQKSFAQYLVRTKRSRLAEAVLAGLPLQESSGGEQPHGVADGAG